MRWVHVTTTQKDIVRLLAEHGPGGGLPRRPRSPHRASCVSHSLIRAEGSRRSAHRPSSSVHAGTSLGVRPPLASRIGTGTMFMSERPSTPHGCCSASLHRSGKARATTFVVAFPHWFPLALNDLVLAMGFLEMGGRVHGRADGLVLQGPRLRNPQAQRRAWWARWAPPAASSGRANRRWGRIHREHAGTLRR